MTIYTDSSDDDTIQYLYCLYRHALQ